MPITTAHPEYDPANHTRPKRAKRISVITGKPTALFPETEIQIQCVTYYRKRRLIDPLLRAFTRLYAVGAAEGNIPLSARVLMKRMGKEAGPHDLHFLDKRGKFQYTWIEIKWNDNDYTKEQREYAEWLSDTPIRCLQVRSLNEFISIIGA